MVSVRTSRIVEINTELAFERMKKVVSRSVRDLSFFSALIIAGCYFVFSP